MAKHMRSKQFEVDGFINDLEVMKLYKCGFLVTVSNDSHCTVSLAPMVEDKDTPLQFTVDFTKVLKALEG